MKTLRYLPFILALITMSRCTAQTQLKTFDLIEYKAQTRGSFEILKIEGNLFNYSSQMENKSAILSDEQIQKINTLVASLNMSEIGNLEAPTTKRFSDGAMSAIFTFLIKGNRYESSEFDHENPPKELKELYIFLAQLKP